jgi:hypothetical protein
MPFPLLATPPTGPLWAIMSHHPGAYLTIGELVARLPQACSPATYSPKLSRWLAPPLTAPRRGNGGPAADWCRLPIPPRDHRRRPLGKNSAGLACSLQVLHRLWAMAQATSRGTDQVGWGTGVGLPPLRQARPLPNRPVAQQPGRIASVSSRPSHRGRYGPGPPFLSLYRPLPRSQTDQGSVRSRGRWSLTPHPTGR